MKLHGQRIEKQANALIRKLEKEKVIGGVEARAVSRSIWVDSTYICVPNCPC